MKNIKIKLGIIVGLFFTAITSANRDAVQNITYRGNVHNPYNLKITTINKACNNSEKSYEGNVFSELNLGSDNGLNCIKTGIDNVTCTKSIANNGPDSAFSETFYVYSTYKNLAKKLNIPSKISDKLPGDYKQYFNLKMLLSTNDNGGDLGQSTYFDFSKIANPFGINIEYSDESECAKCKKIDILNGSGAKIGEKDDCVPPTPPVILDPQNCTADSTCPITDDKKPAKFLDAKIEGCNEISGEYYCLASSSFDFKVSLSELGFDGSNSQGINSLKVGINNNIGEKGNTQLSENNWKNFSDLIETTNFSDNISISDTYFQKKGDYTLEISGRGGNGAYIYQITPIYKKIHILPNNDFKIISTSVSSTNGYANNSDNYIVTANITDSFGNTLDKNYLVNGSSIVGEGFDTDKTSTIFDSEGLKISNSEFNNNKFTFDLKSLVPGSKSINFKIFIPEHEIDSVLTAKTIKKELNFNQDITFLKPFITNDFTIVNSNKKLEIGPSLNMNLEITAKSILKDYSINDFSNNINLGDTINHEFIKQPVSIQNDNLKYSFTIDAKTSNGIDVAPSILLDKNPIISYIIDGKNIKYYINKSTDPNNDDKLLLSGVKGISGIKVVGNYQITGKAEITNNIVKFSDLSKSTMRSTVKKNASIITKGLTVGKLVNGVIYYNGDKKISDINLSGLETLIIKNGNLIIDQNNLGLNKDKLGIIVTRDDNSKTNLGNIYITPGITYIKSSIYADGGIISSNESGIPYISDTDERTNILNNQLIIKGSILTRNTIGGAVNAGGKYILPGGETTTSFDSAMIYDLNYLRRSNIGWDSNKSLNNNNSNNVVIIYNSLIQTNPPKGFSN